MPTDHKGFDIKAIPKFSGRHDDWPTFEIVFKSALPRKLPLALLSKNAAVSPDELHLVRQALFYAVPKEWHSRFRTLPLEEDDSGIALPHPASMWDLLVKEFRKSTAVHILDLENRFSQLKMLPGESFSAFLMKLEGLAAELAACDANEAPSEMRKLNKMLGGLPSHAFQLVAHIKRTANLSFSEAKKQLIEYFDMYELSHPAGSPSSLSEPEAHAAIHGKPQRWCETCQSSSHTSATCWKLHPEQRPAKKGQQRKNNTPSTSKGDVTCSYCKHSGHTIADCPK
ncbi:MAG TPA: hypothetical protein V6C97_05695, partial [Oculatellaceae cyanobacterium]